MQISSYALIIWSHLPESNWRPTDYKSVALPTELKWQCFTYRYFPCPRYFLKLRFLLLFIDERLTLSNPCEVFFILRIFANLIPPEIDFAITPFSYLNWLGWLDSNQRMTESKSVALPLGDTPNIGGKGGI
jgi:hypothetical protein